MSATLIAFDQELDRFKQTIKNPASENIKSINTLFNLLNTYKEKVKQEAYLERLLSLGDFLFSKQCYKLSAFQCYGWYLRLKLQISNDELDTPHLQPFLEKLDKDLRNGIDVTNTLRGLLGYSSSACLNVISEDPKVINQETSVNALRFLQVLQLTMQTALANDSYCWLVFNGTVHIFTISTKLLRYGLTACTLDYLIWACVCMESSVPLMTVKYLGWRTQLYATTCQCYYDLKADSEAEKFARRGLQKIKELQEIEQISTSITTPEVTFKFKQATLKMNIMVFKRYVFESRRRPKGVLRPKMKPMFKDIVHNSWPRTGTERQLSEMFTGRSAQLLAILESLSNTNRRIIQTSVGALETDDCIHDVYMELFFAAIEIIAGGGGTKPPLPGKSENPVQDYVSNMTLSELASAESPFISLKSVVRFVMLSYNYENWDAFSTLVGPTVSILKSQPKDIKMLSDINLMELLSAMSSVNPSRVKTKFVMLKSNENPESNQLTKNYKAAHIDDLFHVASVLHSALSDEHTKHFVNCYHDILVDVVLFLWAKCKNHFSRIHSATFDSHKALYQDPFFEKWVQMLMIIQEAMLTVNIQNIDLCVVAESSLKLAMVLECLAFSEVGNMSEAGESLELGKDEKTSSESEWKSNLLENHFITVCRNMNIPAKLLDMLKFVESCLLKCINAINTARDDKLLAEGSVTDTSLIEKNNETVDENMLHLNSKAYHLEVVYQFYHIQSLIKQFSHEVSIIKTKSQMLKKNKKIEVTSGKLDLSASTGKNNLLKSLEMISRVDINMPSRSLSTSDQLQEAYSFLQRAIKVEEKLYVENVLPAKVRSHTIPPPPILLKKGASCVILKAVPFNPACGEEICWFSIFVRNAAGHNVKVRLSDNHFKGTGEQIPFKNNCIFVIQNLNPNEKYVAAVAAYNNRGKLIGGSIGQTSRPFLAAHPLSLIITFGYLAKVAFQKQAFPMAKLACNVFWNHYVEVAPQEQSTVKTIKKDYKLIPKRLKWKNLNNSSIVAQRQFVQCVFIMVDMSIKEGALFCDSLCEKGPAASVQISRLQQCEKLLLAVEVAGLLNDNALCLQAVVQTYGLLVPIIYWKLPLTPVLEILSHVFGVLLEVHMLFKNKKGSSFEPLQHMIVCLTNYVSKILIHFEKLPSAHGAFDICNKILATLAPTESGNAGIPNSYGDNNTVKKNIPQKKAKKKGKPAPVKTMNDYSIVGAAPNLRALEIFQTKLTKADLPDADIELSGAEDPVILNAVTAVLPTIQAYKEVLKFKRRTQFLECFAVVLSKAANDKLHEMVLEWTKDCVTWLTKRNEIILNKSSNDPRGVVIIAVPAGDEKLKQYSAGVVEYGKVGPSDVSKTNVNEFDTVSIVSGQQKIDFKEQNMESDVKKDNFKRNSIQKNIVTVKKVAVMTLEEKTRKEAILNVQKHLPVIWKVMKSRRKLRIVSLEELPWRSQMNFIAAGSYFDISMEKFSAMAKRLGNLDLHVDDSILDSNLFSLSTSGRMIVSWAGCLKTINKSLEKTVDIGGKTQQHQLEMYATSGPNRMSLNVKGDKKYSSVKHGMFEKTEDSRKQFLLNLEHTYLCYRRSLVLSHRGQNWVLFQNVCASMLSTTHTILTKIVLLNATIDTTKFEIPFYPAQFRSVVYKAFSMATDFILDMLTDFDACAKEVKESSNLGDVCQNKGGSRLTFDPYFDDNSSCDYGNLKRFIMFAIEVMFYEEKWESLCSIIMRFNALSQNHFAESLMPILVYSQRCLHNRISSDMRARPRIIFDKTTGVPIEISLVPVTPTPIEIGAHIDPEGHNLYKVPEDGLKYPCVPTDFEKSLNEIPIALERKPYLSRMLERSRTMLMAYLAGKYANGMDEGKINTGSHVSFLASQVKPLCAGPEAINDFTFESTENLEFYPVVDAQLAVLISSYDKTIEMLVNWRYYELAAQAMHELGNVLFHINNHRIAYKWWSKALNCILKTEDAQKCWRKLIDSSDRTVNSFQPLLERCGIWGCLLGGIIAVKIARYIHHAHIDLCVELCHMAAAFFKALYCGSIVHPSAYHEYATYDITTSLDINHIIPGLNIFADLHRIHCSSLASCIMWSARFLIKRGYYIKVQPLLTLSQYVTSAVCNDLKSAVQVKIMRVESLCKLQKFTAAIQHFTHIITGNYLPLRAKSMFVKSTARWNSFDSTKPLDDPVNVQILMVICSFTLSPGHFNIYGHDICHQISIVHAMLMLSVSSLIYEISEEEVDVVVKEPKEANPTKSPRAPKASSMKKTGEKSKSTTEDDSALSLNRLKGDLLTAAETRIDEMLNNLPSSLDGKLVFTNEQLEVYCQCTYLLSKIHNERLLTLTAACTVRKCLQAISDASTGRQNTSTTPIPEIPLVNNPPNEMRNNNLNSGVDISFWLACRRLLCSYLHYGDTAFGRLAPANTGDEVGSVEENLAHGITECRMANDSTTKLALHMNEIEIMLKHGKDVEDVISELKKLDETLCSSKELSYEMKRLQIDARLLMADIKALKYGNAEEAVVNFTEIEEMILQEMLFQGYDIDSNRKFPVQPFVNTHCHLFDVLLSVKSRCYRARALNTPLHEETVTAWNELLTEITEALAATEMITCNDVLVKMELMNLKGEIQRLLYDGNEALFGLCVDTFLNLIQLCNSFNKDFSLLRHCYIEIALAFLSVLKQNTGTDNAIELNTSTKGKRKSTQAVAISKNQSLKPNSTSSKASGKEIQRLTKAAWVCIRTACMIAKCQGKVELMPGNSSVTSLAINSTAVEKFPIFALEDILGAEESPSRRMNDQGIINFLNDSIEVTWVHVLNYATYLRRNCSYGSLALTSNDISIVRVPMNTQPRSLKLTAVTNYLAAELNIYERECCPILPVDIIQSILMTLKVFSRYSSLSLADPEKETVDSPVPDGEGENFLKRDSLGFQIPRRLSASSVEKLADRADRLNLRDPVTAGEYEVAFQWHKVKLSPNNHQLHLVAAFNSKPIAGSSPSNMFAQVSLVKHLVVDQQMCLQIHDELQGVLQAAEADIATTQGNTARTTIAFSPGTAPQSSSSKSPTPGKKQNIKNTKKQEKDEQLKVKLNKVIGLMKSITNLEVGDEVPNLEASWNNIASLETMFNPSLGHISRTGEALYTFIFMLFQKN